MPQVGAAGEPVSETVARYLPGTGEDGGPIIETPAHTQAGDQRVGVEGDEGEFVPAVDGPCDWYFDVFKKEVNRKGPGEDETRKRGRDLDLGPSAPRIVVRLVGPAEIDGRMAGASAEEEQHGD